MGDVVLRKVRALRDRQAQRFQTRGYADCASGESFLRDVTLDEVFEYMNSSFPANSRSNVVSNELSALRVTLAYANSYEDASHSLPPIVVDGGPKFTALPGE